MHIQPNGQDFQYAKYMHVTGQPHIVCAGLEGHPVLAGQQDAGAAVLLAMQNGKA